jgi:sugar lactone lactonase YvrE
MRPKQILPSFLVLCLISSSCGLDPEKRNRAEARGAPLVHASVIETVLELEAPPGNVTVSADDRVFFTFHPAASPVLHLAEALPKGGFAAFPDEKWQKPRQKEPYFISPLAVRADDKGRLWVLDHGNFGKQKPSLTAFDIGTREVLHRYEMGSKIAGWGSMVNDFWVDAEREVIYIADTSPYRFNPALIVYEVETGRARRLLDLGLPLQIAVDSIALSTDGERLFFGALTGSSLYSIDTAALRQPHLAADLLAERVRTHVGKPSSDGIVADSEDNLYVTAIEDDAIWGLKTGSEPQVLARSTELLSWPDGLHLTPDGHSLYVTASELQHVIGADLDLLQNQRPFRILKIPLLEVLSTGSAGGIPHESSLP